MNIKFIALDFGGVLAYKKDRKYHMKDDAIVGLNYIKGLNIPCTIWTNNTKDFIGYLYWLGILDYFNPSLICNSYTLPPGNDKPAVGFYTSAINLLKMSYSDVLFVDDTKENIEVASKLGINSILYESPLKDTIIKGLSRARRNK